jgi:hypothetical protein
MNLLKETIKAIEESDHTPEDIIFIGSEHSGHSCTWDEFKVLANIEYDSGFGGQEIATDLIIMFSDGMRMWRGEYDGSEWWDYSPPFTMPTTHKKILSLKSPDGLWDSLETIHEHLRG